MVIVRRDDLGIKFYTSSKSRQPKAIIYDGSKIGIIVEEMMSTRFEAERTAELLQVIGVFIQSLQAQEDDKKKKVFPVIYRNEIIDGNDSQNIVKYSPRNVLDRLLSDKIVTVNKRERMKYQFISFGYKDDKLIVYYKPVVW